MEMAATDEQVEAVARAICEVTCAFETLDDSGRDVRRYEARAAINAYIAAIGAPQAAKARKAHLKKIFARMDRHIDGIAKTVTDLESAA